MQALVALKDFPYAKIRLRPGDTFLATPRDARILCALKKAQIDAAGSNARSASVAAVREASVREVVEEVMEVAQSAARRPYRRRATLAEQGE